MTARFSRELNAGARIFKSNNNGEQEMKTQNNVFIDLACLAVGLFLMTTAQAGPILGHAGYDPSTDITFDVNAGVTSAPYGSPLPTGYVLTSHFQLNLLHDQTSGTDADVDNFNDWTNVNLTGPDGTNWHDPGDYVLNLDIGAAEIFVFDGDGTSNGQGIFFDWTITGWTNTILAGNLVDNDVSGTFTDGDFLQLVGGYRTFPSNPNAVEIWGGQSLYTEVSGYTLDLTGGNLEVAIKVPEPSTVLLFGAGLAFIGLKRRKFLKK
jgi:hypothetical protein